MKNAPLKLTISAAAIELSIDRKTLRARLADANEQPDDGGLFTLRQIVSAVHGAAGRERLRLLVATRELAELKAARERGAAIAAGERICDLCGWLARRPPLLSAPPAPVTPTRRTDCGESPAAEDPRTEGTAGSR